MNNLQTFTNDMFGQIRTTIIEGEPWFVGKDIAVALGYSDPTGAIRKRIDDEDKGVAKMATPSGTQAMSIINESGLYALIFGSKLPSAKQFKRWVTSEVLPQINRTGGYIPMNGTETTEDIMAKAVLIAQNTIEQKDALITKQSLQIKAMQPKVIGYETFLRSKGYVSLNKVAKSLHKGRNKMMAFLREQGILFRDGRDNIAYQRFCNAGYFTVDYKTGRDGLIHAVTKVSAKGIDYIRKLYEKSDAAQLNRIGETA